MEPLSVVNGVVSGANVDLMLVGKGLCTMKMYTMMMKASAPRPKRAGGRFVPLVKFCKTPEFILLAMVKILYKTKGWKRANVGDATCPSIYIGIRHGGEVPISVSCVSSYGSTAKLLPT